mgnify:FL=1
MSLLYCKNVTKIYNETLILDNVSFEIDNNEFVSLVGKSGVGKTTLLKLIIGEEKPTKGRIIFSGKDVTKMNCMGLTMLRRKIGVVFQEFKLLSHKTAFENVAFVLESIGLSDEEIQEEVPEVLNLVGLKDKANNFPYQLSAGEKQRVAIARAIIQKPDLLLADEPTGNLDPINKWDIVRLLIKINELGTTVVFATHEKEIVNTMGRRVITLENGCIVRDEQNGKYIL